MEERHIYEGKTTKEATEKGRNQIKSLFSKGGNQ